MFVQVTAKMSGVFFKTQCIHSIHYCTIALRLFVAFYYALFYCLLFIFNDFSPPGYDANKSESESESAQFAKCAVRLRLGLVLGVRARLRSESCKLRILYIVQIEKSRATSPLEMWLGSAFGCVCLSCSCSNF